MARSSTGNRRKRSMWPVRAGGATLLAFSLAAVMLLVPQPQLASAAFVTPPMFTAPIQAAGLTEEWKIGGWQGSLGNHLTSATVTFPAGFVIPQTPTVTVTAGGVRCTVLRAVTANQSVVIEILGVCGSGEVPPRQSITIAGITNPTTPGTIPASGFKLATSVDGEMAAASGVVIWGMTAGPTLCTQVGGRSTGEVRFTSTAETAVANTGSGQGAVITVATSLGSFAQTPTMIGTVGVPTVDAGAASAIITVAPSMSAGAAISVPVVAAAVSGTATVRVRVFPSNGGVSVLLASTEVRFVDGACVPPAVVTPPAPPASVGTFSGTIAPTGVSIVSFTGTTAQLNTAGAAAKLVSVTATVGGKALTFVVGAPDFVNAEFNAAFPTGLSSTLVIVKA